MVSLLSQAAAAVVDEIARTRPLLAFDFDGTLAPIVEDRTEAQMRPETRALLRTAALLYPCAVVSGRTRADVAARVRGIPLVAVVGCHGAEPGFGPLDRALERRVASWRAELERALRGCPVIELEDKRFGIALHYRRARRRCDAARCARVAAGLLEGAVAFGGNAVVNVVPEGAPTKGDALRALCARLGARGAVYVGDDRTDEEAFRSEVVHVAVHVGAEEDSVAPYAIPDQRSVDDLLGALVAARARQDRVASRWEGLVRALGG